MNIKRMVGLTGNIAGGKGVVADLLKNSGYQYFSLSDQVRTIAKKRGLEGAPRAVLQDIGNEMRFNFGGDIFARLVGADILACGRSLVVIDGIRNPAEIGYFRMCEEFLLIAIVAKQENRFKWLLKRSRPSDPKTWEEFLKMDARDLGEGETASGQQVGACIEMADFILPNTGSKEFLEERAILAVRYRKGAGNGR